ncbi:hypothetical protein [uncultured Bacteroides sp.]|uniref:hypothetical protein n=1 Tax=uncultured Bacteroides sp. TaxID=162156 RepID=UPI0025CEC70A|nr:hypothetical protein [uncultured Bacteroides sp.]
MAYTIKNEDALRASINREFIIRLGFPKERRTQLVGFAKFCMIVGNLHAEHYSNKALKSNKHAPTFRGRAGALSVTFYPR